MGISELLTKIGDDKIMFQPMLHAIEGVQAVSEKKGGGYRVTFRTAAITPNDVLGTSDSVPLLVVVKRADFEAAIAITKETV